MIPSLQDFRTIRRALQRMIENSGELPTGSRGRDLAVIKSLLGRVEVAIAKGNKAKLDDRDRKPAMTAEYQGRNVPINGLAPEDLLETFDAECEELGTTRGAMVRELMVKWIRDRRRHKALAKIPRDREAEAALAKMID